ncbi:MAG TPA: UDP-N-acetylmuramoyl-tripeptide--D-alanyl-D-alanine ligase [Sulfurovum sp.]|nr:UDP-N-acetylmuramoyl-tripeptide--D-alanyl-D-alanine ligase [Sulfurovum sp.]
MIALDIASFLIFVMSLGYYLITNLQWNNYRISRVLFHHTKPWWHLVYFVLPFVLYLAVASIGQYGFVVVLGYLVLLYLWYRTLDKPLVFTGRVKRFLLALLLISIFVSLTFGYYGVLIPLIVAYLVSIWIEKILFNGFKAQAKDKIDSMANLIVVGITASYGKTSIKNYIEHLLKFQYKTYATPRSVNTLGGIMKDVNDDLPDDTEVYVVEMGAREEGDISEIATFVNPHFVVVGKIGPAHIEYFKSMENIRNTKMEIMQTNRLKEAWIHESAYVKAEDYVHIFGADITNIEATLESTSFSMDGARYSASILGEFNAMNLAASVKVAKALGLDDEEIQQGLMSLKPVDHRLQRIDAGGKVILDDSFNGNIDGMMASFELASTHEGRKVIITPGLIEVDDDLNIQVAKRANEVFDVVVVTGELNYPIFKEYIDSDKLVKLASKSEMEAMLVEQTRAGDLILFANDAPSFV